MSGMSFNAHSGVDYLPFGALTSAGIEQQKERSAKTDTPNESVVSFAPNCVPWLQCAAGRNYN